MVMRDKRWKKLLGIDAILLGISLLALIVSISLLLKDGGLTNEQHALAKREPVGRFTSSLNDVRRRLDSGFAWTSIKANDHIYEGDNIFTGDDSEAEVQLFRGGSLMVDAKSLVVIRTHESSLHLDLQYGSLLGRVSTEAPLVLSQHGETRILKAPEQGQDAEVRIVSASGRKETKVQVLKGEVQLKNLPRQNPSAPTEQPASTDAGVLIRQNEFVELQPMSKPIVKTIDIELLAPTNGQSIWLEPTHSVQFEWKKKNATTADRIEFSRTASFETVFYSAESTSGTFSLPATQRLEGIFYWRIISSTASLFGASSEPQSSGVNRVALYPDVSPNLLSPDDKQVLTLTQNQSDLLLNLNWDDSSG